MLTQCIKCSSHDAQYHKVKLYGTEELRLLAQENYKMHPRLE